MQPLYIAKSLTGASSNSIATSQTPGGAGNLILNGSTVSGGVATLDTQRRVLITGNGNDLAISFTVYGTFQGGETIQETVAGGNASPYTVATTQDFLTVSRISVSGATAGAITVGTNGVGSTPWKITNWHISPINYGLGVVVSGTVNYTVQYTFDDPTRTYPNPIYSFPNAFNHPVLTSLAVNADSTLTTPVAAYRLTINSGTGTAQLVALQAGIEG